MRHHLLYAAFIASTLALVGACDFNVVVVEVESDEVCVVGLTADVPGDANGSVTVTLSKDNAAPDSEGGAFGISVPDGWIVSDVTLLGVGIQASAGVDNLHFIDSVRLDMTGTHPELDLPTVELLDVTLSELPYNTSAAVTFLEAAGTINLVDYLRAEELEFGLHMDGEMPADDWALAMEVCFTFVAEYTESI